MRRRNQNENIHPIEQLLSQRGSKDESEKLQELLETWTTAEQDASTVFVSALTLASKSGRAASLKLLLSFMEKTLSKLDQSPQTMVNISDAEFGNTPLHHAALRCSYDCLQLLLAAGSHVNAINTRGTTPMHKLVAVPESEVSLACLRLLLEHHADISLLDHQGESCLIKAVRQCSFGAVEILLCHLLSSSSSSSLPFSDLSLSPHLSFISLAFCEALRHLDASIVGLFFRL